MTQRYPFEDIHAQPFLELHDVLLITGRTEMKERQLFIEFTSIALYT
jgi:hypothetical protein